ncbi:uncharacterized protein LOC122016567 [Zingiber officinale]|uniref:DUF4378 domain-containing protein n=1 Tax=Zingiber officinale TaxID=94328 RepID=A0A8J5F299_ZINOF|nr:uncharacterized protein LOC122016567 [Zingiber officinale]KAG6480537.1 hypothetical protein ZIOFF_057121 [Zingiber officinale]
MASVHNPMRPVRRLFELLEEQQEPFLLDVYLLEHGYSDSRAMKATAASICCPGSSSCNFRKLTRFGIYGLRKSRRGLLRFLLDKFAYSKLIRKAWRWQIKDGNRAVEFRRLSYSGGTEEGELAREVLSPVSVLELQAEEEASSSSNFDSPIEKSESPWARSDPPKASRRFIFEPHHFVRSRGSLSEEEILSCESLTHLIASDLSKSSKEWIQFRVEESEVGVEIERIIFEEMRAETLHDVLDSL